MTSDATIDSGAVRAERIPENIPTLQFANSDTVEVGDIVAVIGSPEGFHDTATVGRVSNVHQSINDVNMPAWNDIIFVDADIVFPEQLLKYQLEASYALDGRYVLIPNVVKLGDPSWDVIVHDDFINHPFNQQHAHPPQETINQTIKEVYIQPVSVFKFGCGMHTLYSKKFWDLMGIPESFGGYGPEDTFGMYSATLASQHGYEITQYVLKGIYTTEDYINRIPSFDSKIKVFDRKQEFRNKAEAIFETELLKFKQTLR